MSSKQRPRNSLKNSLPLMMVTLFTLSSLQGNSAPICEIAIDAEGNYFATCAEDMTVSVFDVKHLKHQYTIQIPEYGKQISVNMPN